MFPPLESGRVVTIDVMACDFQGSLLWEGSLSEPGLHGVRKHKQPHGETAWGVGLFLLRAAAEVPTYFRYQSQVSDM